MALATTCFICVTSISNLYISNSWSKISSLIFVFSMDLKSTHVIFMPLRTRTHMVVMYPLATFCGRTGTPQSSICVTTWILVGNLLGDLGLHCFFCACFCLGSESALGSLSSLLLPYPKSVSISESSYSSLWASFDCVDSPEPTCDSDNDVPILQWNRS
jgi:hypothetical protein